MMAFKDSSFLSAVIFSCNLCQPVQSARHLRKLSLPTFVCAECLVTGAQYREGCCWPGGVGGREGSLPAREPCGGVVGISFHDLSIVYCFVT
jgi:hypothetical protein